MNCARPDLWEPWAGDRLGLPGLRQAKLGGGGRDVGLFSETFRRNPVGNQSHPVEPSRQPEARVLRGGGATHPAKRRQRVRMPGDRAPKFCEFAGACAVRKAGAASMPRQGEGTSVLPGSKNRANTHQGSPGTWEACFSPPHDRPGSAEPQTSRSPVGHPGPRETKCWRQRVVLPGDYQKRGRTERQESERPHSTVEAGEPISAGPWGGKGGVESSNRWRETCRRHRTPTTCPRNDSE